jgi:NAD(P)-dependent dehydrogenase (short-subunit alcohol dehydrogenase family)
MISEFVDRVAVVTGGASGIGKAMAVAFRDLGMRVVIADIEEAAMARAANELGVTGVCTDVSDPVSVQQLADTVVERFGTCDLLLNNAGVGGTGRLTDQTLHDWNWIIDVNLRGVIHVLHAFLPVMLANPNHTHIVNTSSIAGLGAFVSAPYTATKYAVVGISESMRHELAGTNVGVSVLCPGFVNTNLGASDRNRPEQFANADSTRRKPNRGLLDTTKLRFIEPESVAQSVVQAVRNDQFWIITDPSLLALTLPRADELRNIATGGGAGAGAGEENVR